MTVIRQEYKFEMGFEEYSIGRIISLTPEQLQIEVLVQDVISLRGLPVSLTRYDRFENGAEKTIQSFDGWVKNAIAVAEESETAYCIVTAENQVNSALTQTLLHTVRAEASTEEILITEVQSRTGAALLVPDAQSLMAELLRKKTSDFYPSYIATYLIESVMHADAVSLYTSMRQCISDFDSYRKDLPEAIKNADKVAIIEMSGEVKINEMTSVESPYLWRKGNFLTLQSSAFYFKPDVSEDQRAWAENLYDKSNLTAHIVYYRIMYGFQGPYPATLSKDVFIRAWVDFVNSVMAASVVSDAYQGLETYIESKINERLTFQGVDVWYSYKDKSVTFTDRNTMGHTYLANRLGLWISANEDLIAVFNNNGKLDIDKYRNIINLSSFVRSGTTAGTLRYWNGRIPEKIIDTARLFNNPKNPFEILNVITKRAGMDIARRQLQFASEGSLLSTLSTFYSSYFMRVNACYPAKGYTDDGNIMTGSFMVGMNNSMGIAPSFFIPLELWQTSGFTATARPDREEFYFFVRDKVIRDLIEKDSPPYLFNYKEGWGDLIEIGNMDDFFAKDYLRSLYRTPVITELSIDRTLLSAMNEQNGESLSKTFAAQTANNDVVDPVTITKYYFDDMFSKYYDSITGTNDVVTAVKNKGIDPEVFNNFYKVYLKYLKQAESTAVNVSTRDLAAALLRSFTIYQSVLFNAVVVRPEAKFDVRKATSSVFAVDEIENDIRKVGSFYPSISADTQENLSDTSPLLPPEHLVDSIRNYLNSGGYTSADSNGNSQSYVFSPFYKNFCRGRDFTYKNDSGFVKFKNYLHVAEGKDNINTMDGTKSLQIPSRYGLQIDKLMLFVRYHCDNRAIDVTEFNGYMRTYHNIAVALQTEIYNKMTPAEQDKKDRPKISQNACKEIINKIVAANPNSLTAKLFGSFLYFSADEASEMTYWVMFRGTSGSDGVSMLKGEKNRPGFKFLSIFLDAYFQHGGSADTRFVNWYNDVQPLHAGKTVYSFQWEKMSEEHRKLWTPILGTSLDSNFSISKVCARLASENKNIDADKCVESLIKYRQYVYLSAATVSKGYETGRLNPLIQFVKGLPSSDSAAAVSTISVPSGYETLLNPVTDMLIQDLERTPDPNTYLQPPVISGLPYNMINFKPFLKSFVAHTPSIKLKAVSDVNTTEPLFDTVGKSITGSRIDTEDNSLCVFTIGDEVSGTYMESFARKQANAAVRNAVISKAAALLAYSCGAYFVKACVTMDDPELFKDIAGVYQARLSTVDYNTVVFNTSKSFLKKVKDRYKKQDVDISKLSARERRTLNMLRSLYFVHEIIKDSIKRYDNSFIAADFEEDYKDAVRKGMLASDILCKNVIGVVERFIMSEDFTTRMGTDVEVMLMRSPVQPIPEEGTLLSSLTIAVGKGGSLIEGTSAYTAAAQTKGVAGADITYISEITPESIVKILSEGINSSDSTSAAASVIIKLVAIHLFFKLAWKGILPKLLEKLYEEPVQDFPAIFKEYKYNPACWDDRLKQNEYNVKMYATEDLFNNVFNINDTSYKKKYGAANIDKDQISVKFETVGIGKGEPLEKFNSLNETIMTSQDSIFRKATNHELREAADVWKGITGSEAEPSFVIFYYKDLRTRTIHCGVIVDLSQERSYVKAVKAITGSTAPVQIMVRQGYQNLLYT